MYSSLSFKNGSLRYQVASNEEVCFGSTRPADENPNDTSPPSGCKALDTMRAHFSVKTLQYFLHHLGQDFMSVQIIQCICNAIPTHLSTETLIPASCNVLCEHNPLKNKSSELHLFPWRWHQLYRPHYTNPLIKCPRGKTALSLFDCQETLYSATEDYN